MKKTLSIVLGIVYVALAVIQVVVGVNSSNDIGVPMGIMCAIGFVLLALGTFLDKKALKIVGICFGLCFSNTEMILNMISEFNLPGLIMGVCTDIYWILMLIETAIKRNNNPFVLAMIAVAILFIGIVIEVIYAFKGYNYSVISFVGDFLLVSAAILTAMIIQAKNKESLPYVTN